MTTRRLGRRIQPTLVLPPAEELRFVSPPPRRRATGARKKPTGSAGGRKTSAARNAGSISARRKRSAPARKRSPAAGKGKKTARTKKAASQRKATRELAKSRCMDELEDLGRSELRARVEEKYGIRPNAHASRANLCNIIAHGPEVARSSFGRNQYCTGDLYGLKKNELLERGRQRFGWKGATRAPKSVLCAGLRGKRIPEEYVTRHDPYCPPFVSRDYIRKQLDDSGVSYNRRAPRDTLCETLYGDEYYSGRAYEPDSDMEGSDSDRGSSGAGSSDSDGDDEDELSED